MNAQKAEQEVFLGVIRPSGQAMFHRQDCDYAKRAMGPLHYLADDFARGDVWCSRCCHDLRFPPAKSSGDGAA